MPQANVMIIVRKVSPVVSIIDIQGEVSAFAEKVLMDAYTEASTSTTSAIILNFSGLEYMNSSGIGLLVTLLIRVSRQKQRLLAFGLSHL
jgi:anti-sigma B factor antagonist